MKKPLSCWMGRAVLRQFCVVAFMPLLATVSCDLRASVAAPSPSSVAAPSPSSVAAPSPSSVTAVDARLAHRVDDARAELSRVREEQSVAREALLRDLSVLRADVRESCDKADRCARHLASARERLTLAQRGAEGQDSLAVFAGALLSEYRRALESRLRDFEMKSCEESFTAADRSLASQRQLERLAAGPELLGLSERILGMRWGACEFPGQALDEKGKVMNGRFLSVGPTVYFRATDGGVSGLVSHRLGNILSTVVPGTAAEAMAGQVGKSAGLDDMLIPFDATLGGAVKLAAARETWREHLCKGGITMVPLLALAAVCGVLAIWKIMALFALREISTDRTVCDDRVREVVEYVVTGRTVEAAALAAVLPGPVGPVVEEGVRHADASPEAIEEVMSERLLAQIPRLERFLTPIAVCATAAPLLGLLGTVTGMIHTFRLITVFGTGDARLLSSGISEALITTEFGLMIAIPAMLVHAWLSRRVSDIVSATQRAAILFANAMKFASGVDDHVAVVGREP